jgi:uncharacterized membrane protein
VQNGSVSWQWKSILVVWVLALAGVVVIAVTTGDGAATPWIGLTAAVCTITTLAIQIGTGRKEGYVDRVSASIVGTVILLAAANAVFALAGRG